MIWVGWRQQRVETLIAAAMVCLLAAVAIPAGLHMASVYSHEGLAVCAGNVNPGVCGNTVSSFLVRFNGLNLLFTWSTLVPALAALLFAAPFVLDLDNGTYRLYWTQSITRRRWVVTKLAFSDRRHCRGRRLPDRACNVVAGAARPPERTAECKHLRRRRARSDRVRGIRARRRGRDRGALAANGSGAARLVRRLRRRPGVSWTAGYGSGCLRRFGRPGLPNANGPNLNRALVVDQFISDKNGHRLANSTVPCLRSHSGLLSHTSVCVQPHANGAHLFMTAVYQPASRFWELQGFEFAIVAGIGVLLVVVAGWWTQQAHRLELLGVSDFARRLPQRAVIARASAETSSESASRAYEQRDE